MRGGVGKQKCMHQLRALHNRIAIDHTPNFFSPPRPKAGQGFLRHLLYHTGHWTLDIDRLEICQFFKGFTSVNSSVLPAPLFRNLWVKLKVVVVVVV